jgi:hypothetical protein
MDLQDLQGEIVWYQPVRDVRYPAMIITPYPDGSADLVVFLFAGTGSYTVSGAKFGRAHEPTKWSFKTMPPTLQEKFAFMKPDEPPAPVKVEKAEEGLFADETEPGSTVSGESASSEPVRRPAIKASRIR